MSSNIQFVFEKILLPIDFSEQSLMMLDCVAELRQFGSEEVVLLHVTQKDGKVTSEQMRVVEDIIKRLEEQGFEARFVSVDGDPVSIIVDFADKESATLIAMASSGKGRTQEFLLGSTSFGVIRKTAKPVLLNKLEVIEKEGNREVRRACEFLFRTALVPIDLSECTNKMKDTLDHLSRKGLKNVVLLHVIESARYGVGDDKRFAEVKARMEELKKDLQSEDFIVSTHVHYGTPVYNVLEVSREVEASLIIIGRSGKSFLKGLALGSTSEEVIRRATVPLLVISC
jgi:nucleotide-binding universal stress UspA family protein